MSILIGGPLQAASFDCAKAATDVEHIICDDFRLGILDEQYANRFRSEIETSSIPEYLRADGRVWLREVRDACRDATCLINAYTARIQKFDSAAGREASVGSWIAPSSSVEFSRDDEPATPVASIKGETENVGEDPGTSSDEFEQVMVEHSTSRAAVASQRATDRRSVAGAERGRRLGIEGEIESAVLWGIFLSTLALLGLAATNRVVVFHDVTDALWSIVAVVATAAAAFLVVRMQPVIDQGTTATIADYVGLGVIVILAICCMAQNLHYAIKFNSNIVIGIAVAIFKLGAAVALVLTSLGLLGRILDHRSSRRQIGSAAMLFALVGMLWIALINGERVSERRASLV